MLKFNSWCVLFIWFIYKSILYKLFLYIHFVKNIQHIQSRYGSHTVPQWGSDERLFAMRTQVPSVTLSGLSWTSLGRWYGVFEFSFNVLLWWCQWIKRDKEYTYIQQIVHGTEGHMAVYGPVLSYKVEWSVAHGGLNG